MINESLITYCGQQAKVGCDRKCEKAWGRNSRPTVQLSENEDDFAYLSDGELDEAPVDPGTYEGDHAKPNTPDEFPNKWCVRECERCALSMPGEYLLPLKLKTFEKRVYNIFASDPDYVPVPPKRPKYCAENLFDE